MNKFIQIKVFHSLLDQLFDFLYESFPGFKSDFILTRSAMEFVRKGNPRLVAEQFMDYMKPLKKFIFDCDEDFFLNFEISGLSKDEFVLGTKLKKIWLSGNITTEQKAMVFYYFQKLITAGELCV